MFTVRLGIDYFNYDTYNNFVPFYVCVLERGVEFIILSIIVFLVEKVVKKKYSK